jgi:hypothetical protein
MTSAAPTVHARRQCSSWVRHVSTALFLTLTACSHLSDTKRPAGDAPRTQLSIGYSLLYQECDGIPKLKWLFTFKAKAEEMGRLTDELVSYYQQLARKMQKLSTEYPGMRIDVDPMSKIEADTRKAMGEDMAKQFAPLIGKTGTDFEREVLLMFSDSLNEQRHLTEVMIGLETDPGLKKFLQTTNAQLDERHTRVNELLKRRYFIP